MRLKLISCEIFSNEINTLILDSKHNIEVEYLPKGLHDIGCDKMHLQLQKALSIADCAEKYDYILLGYGLCNNGTIGLSTKNIPFVLVRAHDCITLLMGSKKKYMEYFSANPATFYLSPGWIQYAAVDDETSIQSQLSMNKSYEELVKEYGEDNAQFLYETLCEQTINYNKITYIKTIESDKKFEENARQQAKDNNWEFDKIIGDSSLMQRFINAQWNDEEFIIVQPKKKLINSYDEKIFKYKKL